MGSAVPPLSRFASLDKSGQTRQGIVNLHLQLIFGQLSFWGGLDAVSVLVGLILGFLLAVWGRRFWPRLRRYGRQLRTWWRARLSRLRAGVEARLLQETAVYAQRLHLGRAWADLSDVFVPPQLYAPPAEFDPAARQDWGATMLPYLWPDAAATMASPPPPAFSVRQLLQNGRLVLLVAPPGMGKTTLLAHCAYRCATAQPGGEDEFLHGTAPAFLRLDELDLELEPLTAVIAILQQRTNLLTGNSVRRWIDLKAKTGQLLLLLDGWEACGAERQTAVTQWLTRLLEAYPAVRIFLTTQAWGYGPLHNLGFTWAGILPWQRGQIEQLTGRWTRALGLGSVPKADHFWRHGQSPLVTCLRFWLLALAEGGKRPRLPERQTDLLAMTLPLLADAPSSPQRPRLPLVTAVVPPRVEQFWQAFAYQSVQSGGLSLPKERLLALAETLRESEEGASRDLLAGLNQSALFLSNSADSIGFLNEVWRDYLAACYLARNGLGEAVMTRSAEPRWAGVIRFYVGQRGGSELAASLLAEKDASPTRETLFQIASWLPEATDGGEWRQQILILLGQITRQATFPQVLRQRAVAALVQTRETGVTRFLAQLLQRSDPFLRQAGAAALPVIDPMRAFAYLADLLTDPDERVRITAVYALFALNHPDTEQLLLATLIGEDERLSWTAAHGFAAYGAEGQAILKEALEDGDARVRRAAIQGCLRLEEPWVEPLLLRVERHDAEWLVRSSATVALEEWRGRARLNPWLTARPEKQAWLLEYTTSAGWPPPKGAAIQPFLVQILTEVERPLLRAAAAASLGQILDQGALPALENASQDSDPQVREAAATALFLIRRAYIR